METFKGCGVKFKGFVKTFKGCAVTFKGFVKTFKGKPGDSDLGAPALWPEPIQLKRNYVIHKTTKICRFESTASYFASMVRLQFCSSFLLQN